jgi:hypothetical protein
MAEHNYRPYPVPPPDVAPLVERYEGSRTEMFQKVICAVDEACIDAECHGHEQHVRYLEEEEVFPFLYVELA